MPRINSLEDCCEVTIHDDRVLEFIADHYSPEDIFDTTVLRDWALENGFVLRSHQEDL